MILINIIISKMNIFFVFNSPVDKNKWRGICSFLKDVFESCIIVVVVLSKFVILLLTLKVNDRNF